MRKIAEFARAEGFKVFASTSLATISKDGAKFRISRQAGDRFKLSESKNSRIQVESTYHASEEEVIEEIRRMIS
ncbi:hypothetical protein [Salinicoccus halitifaciens]|uniref:Uncharacterized protein n=1 Tax=Salinicoccus halitifaciens TaxID=1073415 RepID=A0ABV2EBC2_9STAP|nr:hypothetical protein [Salinicoccus halitifaciens]MCD2138960.1 hypothetical protein [Salinicoccus halitifaciens]